MGEPLGHEGAIAVFAPVTILTVTLERTADGEGEVPVHPGGQGVWQARMATSLGARAVLCTLLGGEPGIVISALLEAEGLERSEVDLEAPNATWIQGRRSFRVSVAERRESLVQLEYRSKDAELDPASDTAPVDAGIATVTAIEGIRAVPPEQIPFAEPRPAPEARLAPSPRAGGRSASREG